MLPSPAGKAPARRALHPASQSCNEQAAPRAVKGALMGGCTSNAGLMDAPSRESYDNTIPVPDEAA